MPSGVSTNKVRLLELDYARSSALPNTLKQLLARGAQLEHVLPRLYEQRSPKYYVSTERGRSEWDSMLISSFLGNDDLPASVMCQGIWHVQDHTQIIKGTFE